MKRILILISFIAFITSTSFGQKGWEAGGWLGTSFYFGDLNNRLNLTDPGLAGGLNGRYNFNTRVSIKSSLSFARIYASDENSPNNFERNRNLSFRANILDFSHVGEFNFFPYIHGDEEYYFTPYLMMGFSVFGFRNQAELNGDWYTLSDHDTENIDYGTFSGSWVLGGGLKWDINRDYSINIEASYHKLFTDYLDDVSAVYPNPTLLNSQIAMDLSDRSLVDGISGDGRQRGNSKDNDAYIFVGISFMRYFSRLECPRISEPK